ncbi:hypothetical protein RF11_04467 [Thelohanellus kitauei]|uniref:BRWD/PHIP N-terminal domain-containing protein n=1 Tax=Thelohanellus kitauei TaxID=669202 RepID=A0A0C2MYM1_THEKT|nr:hypothetical protein RF11_04467 [Thelohanellus kitauei]
MSSDEKVEISRPIKIEDKIEPDDIKAELLFLISKYLEASDLKDVSEKGTHKTKCTIFFSPTNHFLLLQISSMRVDWEGAEHQMSLSEMASEFNDIPNDHLYISLVKVLETLRSQKDGPHSGVTSLLSSRFPNQICLTFLISKLQNLVLVHRLIKLLLVSVKIDQNPKKQVLGHLASTYCVTFDRTGQRIITGSDDTLIKIWCTSTSQLVSTLRGHAAEICDLAVSNDNKLLASASCDKTVRIWLLQTAAEVCILHGHTSALSSVQFCPRSLENKKYLISTGNDANLCVWSYEDTNFSIEPVKFTEKLKSTSRLVCSSFSPGGKYLVLGSTDARIYVYSIEEEVIKIGDFEAHEDRIDSVDFNHSGEKFLTASNGGQAKIWYPRLSSWSRPRFE